MSGACAVVDLRRPVEPAAAVAELKSRRWDRVFAVTPLAAWTLERAGLAFESNGALVERGAFREGCLGDLERLRGALASAFGPEQDGWMGLTLELTAGAAYARSEHMRMRSLEGLDPVVFSDAPRTGEDTLEAHLYNRSALYLRAVPAERHRLVPRRPEAAARLLNRLKRLTPAALAGKILARLPAPRRAGPALVTDYGYDWAALRPSLEPRFAQWTFADLAREARRLGGAEPDAAALGRLRGALRTAFRDQFPGTLEAFLSLADGRAARYAELHALYAKHMPALASRLDLRAALGTLCGTDEQFLAHYFLKKAGKPSVFYQHGAYMQRWPMTGPEEVVPATHNLVYGSADESFVAGLGGNVRRVGSAALDAIGPDAPRKGEFLYVMYVNPGNLLLAESAYARPDTDHAYLFRRHRRVLELFARRPELRLTVRQHPGQYTWALHEPLAELARGIRNVRFDQSPFDPDRYYSGYEAVLFDYPSTGLLQALAKGKTIACHVGVPYGSDGEDLLRRAISCADDDDAFLSVLERWCEKGAADGDPRARAEYMERFAKAGRPSLSLALPLLDELLA